jgi:16S rRNA (guanine966-N2)-methyltransferase
VAGIFETSSNILRIPIPLRIVAGEWRGRTIKAPPGSNVRPTRDRIREAWMSIVHPYLPGANVLDLCAGSGALGIEALSRGATLAEFVDNSPESITVLKTNLKTLAATSRAIVHKADAAAFVKRLPERAFGVAFADPPYATDMAISLANCWLHLPYAVILGIEHSSTITMPPGGDTRRYGTSSITFYRAG